MSDFRIEADLVATGDRLEAPALLTEIDRVMAVAWPPAEVEKCGGWTCRYAEGVTQRANSVLAIGRPDDLDAAIAGAEDFYRSRAVPPAFLVSEASTPAEVIAALADRGYVPAKPTWMVTGSAEAVRNALASAERRLTVDVSSRPTEAWLDTYRSVQGVAGDPVWDRIVRSHLLQPIPPARYACATGGRDGDARPVAVGQVVVADGWGCLQCLGTEPSGRRRGAATAVFRALADAALEAGVSRLFAAVATDNRASLNLCMRAGLRPSHRYWYLRPAEERPGP